MMRERGTMTGDVREQQSEISELQSSLRDQASDLEKAGSETRDLQTRVGNLIEILQSVETDLEKADQSNSVLRTELSGAQHTEGEIASQIQSGGTSFDTAQTEARLQRELRQLSQRLRRASQLASEPMLSPETQDSIQQVLVELERDAKE